jgi:hypothetical protein
MPRWHDVCIWLMSDNALRIYFLIDLLICRDILLMENGFYWQFSINWFASLRESELIVYWKRIVPFERRVVSAFFDSWLNLFVRWVRIDESIVVETETGYCARERRIPNFVFKNRYNQPTLFWPSSNYDMAIFLHSALICADFARWSEDIAKICHWSFFQRTNYGGAATGVLVDLEPGKLSCSDNDQSSESIFWHIFLTVK